MPNNPIRNKRGYVKIPNASIKAKRSDVVTAITVNNKVFAAAAQELGSPNGGPQPVYGGGGGSS